MDPRVAPLAEILRINTKLARNCVDALPDDQACARSVANANSAAYVAAHMVESRYYILSVLGDRTPSPFADQVGWKAIDEIPELPTLGQIDAAWTEVSSLVDQKLKSLTRDQLDAPHETQMPIESKTKLGIVGFMVQHDSYHLGQLSLLRKSAGLPAMSYT
jgi:uncharacterized damage-inducible protein DinB